MYTVYVRLVVLKRELSLFAQVTTAVFISSRFHSAVITCTNKDTSHFYLYTLQLLNSGPPILNSYPKAQSDLNGNRYITPWTPIVSRPQLSSN